MEEISSLVTQKLEALPAGVRTRILSFSGGKAIATLFPYATRLARGGQPAMANAISLIAQAHVPVFKWRHIGAHITTVFDESSPPSLNQIIILVWPYARLHHDGFPTRNAVARWVKAASTVPYSEVVSRSVVDALLQISTDDILRSQIPFNIWTWLKKRSFLPPMCRGRSEGSRQSTVSHIRGLGDVEILKSYLLLVWSAWDPLDTDGLAEMQTSIREDFGGIEKWGHRDDLIKRLDRVQGALDQGLVWFKFSKPGISRNDIQMMEEQYGLLKNVLLEVDRRATETLTRTPLPPVSSFSICVLSIVDTFRNPFNLCLHSASSMTVISPPGTACVTSLGPCVSAPHSFVTPVSYHHIIPPPFHSVQIIAQLGLNTPTAAVFSFLYQCSQTVFSLLAQNDLPLL
jgi:hypothetical protein